MPGNISPNEEFALVYPTMELFEDRGLIPRIYLPFDFQTLVPDFFKQERRETVEEYAQALEKFTSTVRFSGGLEIRLKWGEELGLTNISVGFQGGLDLVDQNSVPSFQEHNLGGDNGIYAAMVAMKYIPELLKSR